MIPDYPLKAYLLYGFLVLALMSSVPMSYYMARQPKKRWWDPYADVIGVMGFVYLLAMVLFGFGVMIGRLDSQGVWFHGW
jgi:ABC-type proline/glycine betaine transport system permease subunit